MKAAGVSGVRPLMAWRQGILRPLVADLADFMTALSAQDTTTDPASDADAQEVHNRVPACRIALPALEKAASRAFALAAAPVVDSDTKRMVYLYTRFANEVKYVAAAPEPLK